MTHPSTRVVIRLTLLIRMKLAFAVGVAIVLRASATAAPTAAPSAAPSEAPTAAPTAAPSQSPTTHWEYRLNESCDQITNMHGFNNSAKEHAWNLNSTTKCVDRSGCQPLGTQPTVCCGYDESDPSTRCGPYNASNVCVEYQNDGANCKHEKTHPIPRCQDIRTIDDTGHKPEPWFFCSAGEANSSLNTATGVGKCMSPETSHGEKCVNWAKWAFMRIDGYKSSGSCQVNGLESNVNCVSHFGDAVNINEVKVKIGEQDFEVRCAGEFKYTPPSSPSGATLCSDTFYVRLFDNRRPLEQHNDEYLFCAESSTTDESSWRSTPFTPSPTTAPSAAPSEAPTSSPTQAPTTYNDTTSEPTAFPTGAPTGAPTSAPTSAPSSAPTGAPTSPTPAPTKYSNGTHAYLDTLRDATANATARMATYNQAVKDYPGLFTIVVVVESNIDSGYAGSYSPNNISDPSLGKWEWTKGNYSLQFFDKPEAVWWFSYNGVAAYPSHCPGSATSPPNNSEECFPASQGITFTYQFAVQDPCTDDKYWNKTDTDPMKTCKVVDGTIEQDQIPVLSGRVKNATYEVKYKWENLLGAFWCPGEDFTISWGGTTWHPEIWDGNSMVSTGIVTAEECDYGLIPCTVMSEPACSLCTPNAVNNSGIAPRFQVEVKCDDTSNGGQAGGANIPWQTFQTTTCTAEDARSCANPVANESGYVAGGMYNGSDVDAWANASNVSSL